jgi:hypothetical protein
MAARARNRIGRRRRRIEAFPWHVHCFGGPEMDGNIPSIAAPAARPVRPSILLMGLCLGLLTGVALWGLQPDVCSQLCSVHAFLAATIALTLGLYVALGRQEGLPAAASFVMSFGFGVMLVVLAVSAARIVSQGDEGMVEPLTRVIDARGVRAV